MMGSKHIFWVQFQHAIIGNIVCLNAKVISQAKQKAVKLALIIGSIIGFSSALQAQDFTLTERSFTFAGANIEAVDFDNDGDIDIVLGNGNTMSYYQNDGSGNFTQLTGANNPFTGLTIGSTHNSPSMADLDNDGDLDLAVGINNGGINYAENQNGVFVRQTAGDNPFFGVNYFGRSTNPEFVDIDQDGDFDVLVGTAQGRVSLLRNNGDASSPNFVQDISGNPFNGVNYPNSNSPTIAHPAFGDFDGDGLLEVIIGHNQSGINPFLHQEETSPGGSTWQIISPSPFDSYLSAQPEAVDFEGDGDVDVLYPTNNQLTILRNNRFGPPNIFTQQTGSANPFDGETLGAPAFADLDGDGDLDGFFAVNVGGSGEITYYQNDGTGSFTQVTGAGSPFFGFSFATATLFPSFVDWDNDGDMDAFVGGDGGVTFFRNDGTGQLTRFVMGTPENPFTGKGPFSVINSPVFYDDDQDEDMDALVGTSSGILSFRNDGNVLTRRTTGNPFEPINNIFSSFTRPCLADIDRDGDLDLIVGDGASTASLRVFRNDNPSSFGNFVELTGGSNPFSGLANFGAVAFPAVADIDGDEDLDIFVSNSTSISYIENAPNPFLGTGIIGSDLAFVDWDGDNDQDVIIGRTNNANLSYYQNNGDGTFTEQTGVNNPFDGITFTVFGSIFPSPSPSLADLDSDGDKDMYVGTLSGTIRAFENLGGSVTETTGANNPFDGFNFGSGAKPAFVDLDGDNDLDCVVGFLDGATSGFAYLENNAGVFAQQTGANNPFDGFDFGARGTAHPAFFDTDEDGDLDLVVGLRNGELLLLENDGMNNFTELSNAENLFGSLSEVGSNVSNAPEFGDYDGDGDMDLFVGSTNRGVQMRSAPFRKLAEDLPEVSLSVVPTNPSLEDDGQGFTFTLTRTGGDINTPLTVTLGVSGTATYNDDYYLVSGADSFDATSATVTFPTGQATLELILQVQQDALNEPDETIVLTLLGGTTVTVNFVEESLYASP